MVVSGEAGNKGERGGVGGDGSRIAYRQGMAIPRIAFSVTMDHDMPRSAEYRVVKFNIVLNNQGGGFESSTGIFTSPMNGTYLIGFQ